VEQEEQNVFLLIIWERGKKGSGGFRLVVRSFLEDGEMGRDGGGIEIPGQAGLISPRLLSGMV